MAEDQDIRAHAQSLIEDGKSRLQFQHDYTLAGFKALFLMNGGAIIGLLTYAGNVDAQSVASRLFAAFLFYAIGMGLSVFGYQSAYLSQGSFMHVSQLESMRVLGIDHSHKRSVQSYVTRGNIAVSVGIAVAILSLVRFFLASFQALDGLQARDELLTWQDDPIVKPAPR